MFCGNCGSKIEDGAKFCANCGAPVAVAEIPAPAVETVQQEVAETPTPSVEAVQQEVAETPTPVAETVQQAVADTPTPSVEAVQQTVAETPAPAAPIEPLQPEQPVQNISPAPYVQPEAPAQPVMPAQPAMQTATPVQPVKKKKSKAPLIAGLTAGAVLIGGGAVGYFFFHDDITRLIMGPKEYAKMIDKNYLGSVETLDPTSKRYAGYMLNSIDNAVYSLTKTSISAGDLSSAEKAASELANNSLGYADPTWLFAALDMFPEGSTVTIDSNLEVKLGSVFAMLDGDTTKAITDAISNFTITERFSNGDADMMSFGIKNKEGKSGSVDIYMKDGGLLISFTGISDKKIYIPKEDFDAAKSKAGTISADRVKLDINEFERIKNEIVNIYYAAYDTAEITYTDNTEWVQTATGGAGELTASAKGNNVHIVFTSEQVKNMMKSAMELFATDEYLTSYFTTTFNMTAEQYKKMFDAESLTKSINFSLTVDHIVDVHNNVLASGYSLVSDSDKGEMSLKTISTGKSEAAVFNYIVGGGPASINFEIKSVSENKTNNDGNAVFVITPDMNKDISFVLDCEYTGKDTKKFLDRDVIVGKYVIKLSDPDKFIDNIGKLFGGGVSSNSNSDVVALTMAEENKPNPFSTEAMMTELKKFAITIESSVEGDVLNTSFGISAGDIGSVAINTRTEKKDEAAAMPDTTGAAKIDDTDALSGIGADATKWVMDFAKGLDGGNGFISAAIDGLLRNAEKDQKYKQHYAAYTESSKYDADDYAYDITDLLDEQIKNKIESTNEKNVSGVIKLYFDDGKAEIIDNGGINDLSVGDSKLDSVYAEVFYDSRISNGTTGVAVVLTDNKNDLPDALPTIDNFAQGVYPWGENKGYIGDYVVGVSPYLYDGELDPNAVIAESPDLDTLNGYAKDFANALLGYLETPGNISGRTESDEEELIIAFMSNKYTGWYDIGGYAGSQASETGGLKRDFVDGVKETLQKYSDEHSGMPDLHAVFYFRQELLAGVMVSEAGKVYYIDSGLPTADDYFDGSFAGWADSDGDGAPNPGYITDYHGDITPIGTYSMFSDSTLKEGTERHRYDSKWKVTAINGQTIADIAEKSGRSEEELAIYITIEGEYVYLASASTEGEILPLLLTEHEDYEDKKAIGLYNEESKTTEGFIVFDSYTKARLIDTISDLKYDLELISDGNTVTGNVTEDDYYDPMWGKWTDGSKTVAIDSNWILTDVTQMYSSKFYFIFLNSEDENTLKLCNIEDQEQIGLLSYDEENDTLTIEDTDGSVTTYKRVEEAPQYAYFDVWTVDTYAGEPETEQLVFEIGAYSAGYYEESGYFFYDIFDTKETTFKIVFDSSYFLDCTYDKASDKITGVLRFDDTDETYELTMKRTPYALG
ncbi:MAG: zinc-ribbon domain-containing protein [Ruminiclostridium sp.]|nr:zinc-ribbon domain-containing protein [Ruminiclostridium sp.]